MAMSALAAVAWMCVLPPVQGPDEDSHVAYAQRIAERGEIPWTRIAGTAQDAGTPYSTELAYALTYGSVVPSWGNPFGRPARTGADERVWRERDEMLGPEASADGGFTPSMTNPPLYYLYAAVPYLVASGGSIFDRVFAMRFANLVPLLAVLVFTWLTVGELMAGRRALQVLATAAVGLQPQLLHMAAVVNPDLFLAAIWAAALYVMTLIVTHGASRGRLVWLAALAAASCLTQPRGIAIAAPIAATAVLLAWRHAAPGRRWLRTATVAVAAVATVAATAALVHYALRGGFSPDRLRQLGSYLWQFYLPRLSFMDPIVPDYTRIDLFERFVSGFGMLEAGFPGETLTLLRRLSYVVVGSALVGLIVRRHDVRRRLGVLLVFAVAVVGYLGLLHAAAFRSLIASSDPIITGRHLLPLLPVYGLIFALAVAWLPRRAATVAGGVLISGLFVLQLAALGVLFERFYA